MDVVVDVDHRSTLLLANNQSIASTTSAFCIAAFFLLGQRHTACWRHCVDTGLAGSKTSSSEPAIPVNRHDLRIYPLLLARRADMA